MAPIAGHPVLDFANTVAWRTDPDRRAERVTGPAAWLRWAAAAGLPVDRNADRDADRDVLAGLLALRAALWPVLDALVDDAPPPEEAWHALADAVRGAREHSAPPPAFPLRWQPPGLAHALALRAEELLADPALLPRVRRCEGPGCGWFFLDRSRGGTRRWCSSGDCGNRARARRHYARTRGRS
ncbi:CGNR zinc finger domain-containing protein [Streptomyces sp. AV19]|nr:CGNR zinc finger domain-containing protein [Streptomyces sp. AV19]